MQVYIHIPKCGGSTLRTIISRQIGVKHVYYYEPDGQKHMLPSPEVALRRAFERGQVRLVTGHHRFGIHRLLRTPCSYFSFVRDPIERALSEYFYAYSYPHHSLRDRILSGALTVGDFLDSFPGNAQAIQLAGDTRVPGISWEDQACINMRDSLMLTGVSESFDLSVLLLARRLGWRVPLYVPTNVTKLSDEQAAWRRAARMEAQGKRQRFSADYQVYESAKAQLEALRVAEGAALAEALAAFQRLLGQLHAKSGESIYRTYNFGRDDELPPEAEELARSDDYRCVEAYLRSEPAAAPRLNLIGVVDAVKQGVVSGWAFSLSTAEPLLLEVRVDGIVVGNTLANRPRLDVESSGWGRTSCGFRLDLPQTVGPNARVEVVVAGMQTQLRMADGASRA